MSKRSIATLLAAISLIALAVPVLADTSLCVVKAPEIRLRKSPSKKARVIAVLKKDARVNAETCGGGWVKVSSPDGHLAGYVGGWALSAEAPKVTGAAAPVVVAATPAPPPVAAPAPVKPEPVKPTPVVKEVPTNEKLAIQITELRLNVLGIERDMDKMNKDIQKIKTSLRKSGGSKKVAHSKKARKLMAKR
ncbi:hypothetical protein GMLC_09220 [Geomonas limicola]|uniref:SH3b domain-containing protein n=1 Tax=Geomonas limicola TaxID=2740186 RepID=A0A6V8N721_9BACT|nr:SH3 domain-containing protein [Geomonas limicola]GFO67343.1 hypothetical protein GMLC_09220 [Geomonas limicola]